MFKQFLQKNLSTSTSLSGASLEINTETKVNPSRSKGFTLLFAVLVAVVVLSVSISMISVSIKQNRLSAIGKESLYAFYAANTALECAMYWDYHEPAGNTGLFVFPNQVESLEQQYIQNNIESVKCAGTSIITKDGAPDIEFLDEDWWVEAGNNPNNNTTFKIAIYPDDDDAVALGVNDEARILCAEVSVRKEEPNNVDFRYLTRIEAQGYSSCDTTNPRTVQRGLVIEYLR